MKPAHEPASSRPMPCASMDKRRRNLARSPLLAGHRRKKTVSRQISFSLRNLPVRVRAFPLITSILALKGGSALDSSPGSSTIEVPSALAESGAY